MEIQAGLFSADAHAAPIRFDLPDAEVVLHEKFFEPHEADALLDALDATVQWRQETIRIFGRTVDLPRLTAWYGDAGKTYSYSGIAMRPLCWSAGLLRIKERVEQVAEARFSSVLLNLYRSGRDSVAWHSDDETELGRNPVIGSVSFGQTRLFQMRHSTRKELPRVDIPLPHGSFLLMRGATQHHWQHRIAKTNEAVERRINLTFRQIL